MKTYIEEKYPCFMLCMEASWDLQVMNVVYNNNKIYRELYNIEYNQEQNLLEGLEYAKKIGKSVDKILLTIERKNGKDIGLKAFKYLFNDFDSIDEIYDYCFDICNLNNKDKLEEASKKLGINLWVFKDFAKESKKGTLIETEKRINDKIEYLKNNLPELYNAIEFLYNTNNFMEIIDYFDKHQIEVLQKKSLHYIFLLHPELSKEEAEHKILNKYSQYKKYKKELELSKPDISKALNEAKDYIKGYINNDFPNILSYCNNHNITYGRFYYFLKLIKEHDYELFEEYNNKKKQINSQKYAIIVSLMRKIANYIIGGFNGKEFTIIDYYKLTNVPLDKFYSIVRSDLSKDCLIKIKKFIDKYGTKKTLKYSEILSLQIEVNCQKDSNGFPIPGSGHIVTDIEKKAIIDTMKKNNLPMYQVIYDELLKEYLICYKEEQNKLKL